MNLALPHVPAIPAFPRFALFRFPAQVRRTAKAGAVHEVAKGACLHLGNAEGRTVTCTLGTLWLTHDGDCKDVVIEAGQSHAVTRPQRLIVQALEDAVLQLG
jgi:hypothetical protein